jgi:hypothetical protein
MAAGEEVERATRDVLADVLAVMGADSAAHWDTIAGRLAQQMPEIFRLFWQVMPDTRRVRVVESELGGRL